MEISIASDISARAEVFSEVLSYQQLTYLQQSISLGYALPGMGTRNEIFAANLERLRRGAGMTQEQLAEKMHRRQSAVSNLESGKRGLPSGPTLILLAEALNCPIDALFDGLIRRDVDKGAEPVVARPEFPRTTAADRKRERLAATKQDRRLKARR